MLSLGEEVRLAACVDVIEDAIRREEQADLKNETLLWLATNLRREASENKDKSYELRIIYDELKVPKAQVNELKHKIHHEF